jgi:hypothetical protein
MWAPGSQLKCSGEVLRWHFQDGAQAVPVAQYIQDLEAENRGLKQEASDCCLRVPVAPPADSLEQQVAPCWHA